jgi:Methyltransferase domain
MPTVMGWKTKANFLALASRTPGGRLLYQRFQDIQASRMADADTMLDRAVDLFSLYRDTAGLPLGRDFLEVGTGWCPWVPLILRLAGAGTLVTLDVNPWLSHKTAVRTTRALLDRAGKVADAIGVQADFIAQELCSAVAARTLDEWLLATRIQYRTRIALEHAGLPAASFDAVLSSNVLEHVPPSGLRAIHGESHGLLRAGGVVAHRFNPQDHYSEGDASITGANFLQYSESEWQWWGGSGLSYHNRLRCPQHAELITDAAFEILYRRTRSDEMARRAIESGALPVHPEFAHMSAADLSDDYMWIVARRLNVVH